MEHILVKCLCAVLAVIILCFDVSLCLTSNNNIDNLVRAAQNEPENKDQYASTLWFGPRIGRKKRTEKFDENKIADILESLDEYPWTLIAINENKEMEKRGNPHNFTPRLGRTLEENHLSENSEISERSPPFSPRLGRSHAHNLYSPRLGRDESGRSHAYNPYSPRLGRDESGRGHAYSPFSPRLGRDESYV